MITIKRLMRRGGSLAAVLAFGVAVVAFSVAPSGTVQAAMLTNRSLTMASNNISGVTSDANGTSYAAGSFFNGSQTSHTFTFDAATAAAPQGILLMYCTTPLPQTTCTAPSGLSVSGMSGTITTTGVSGSNSYTVDNSVDASRASAVDYFGTGFCAGSAPARTNCVLLTNASATSTGSGTTITVPIGNATNGWVTNPDSAQNFYVRIQTFSGTAFTNAQKIDNGAVAGTVSNSVEIDSAVQEALNFSVGTNAPGIADCNPVTGTAVVGLGTSSGGVYLLGTTASYASSYWRLNTNAANGVNVYYRGKSLENTANTAIATSTTPWTPANNVERFGLTVDSNDASNYSFTNLASQAPYDSPTQFAFDTSSTTAGTPALLATASAGTTVSCDTASMKYVGEASTTTQPGIYKTNIIYYAVPTY